MNRIVLIIVFFMGVGSLFSQPKKYLVWLADKNQSAYTIENPAQFLSQRALDRRTKQGIAIDSLDLPVSNAYINTLKTNGVSVLCSSKWLNTVTIETDSVELVQQIKNLPFVDSVQLTWVSPMLKSASLKLEPLLSDSYIYGLSEAQIAMHNGHLMHQNGFTGKGKLIAVLDAGFFNVNTFLSFDSLWKNDQIIGTRDFVNPGGDVFTQHTHGMAVLSIMGGNVPEKLIGSAPGADYFLIRTEDGASEYPVEMDYWIAGAELADSIGADIINSSLGYSVFDDVLMNYTNDDLDGGSIRVTRGADIAASRGILVVTSAGNEGNKTWKKITAPADGKKVLAVGSVLKDSTYSAFSSRGPTADGRVKPDVMANGSSTIIQSSNNTIGSGSGTSFSGPVMAGMAATLWQALPGLTAEELKDLIVSSGDRYFEPSDTFGYGIPDIYYAWTLATNYIEPESIGAFKVYPNPMKGNVFTIETNSVSGYSTVILYTIDGREVFSKTLPNNGVLSLTLPDFLKPGIYLLKVLVDEDSFSTKLLVQ